MLNILLVEDDAITRSIIAKHIENWGYTVYLAENGISAWETINMNPIHMVITDWLMPELDGMNLSKRIREANFGRYIYLIVISSLDARQDIVDCLEAGVDDYLAKPVNLSELSARMKIGERIINLEGNIIDSYEKKITGMIPAYIDMLSKTIEAYDISLYDHCNRVADLSIEIAKKHPRFNKNDYDTLFFGAKIHDIGMIGLPKEILSKKRTEMQGDEQMLFQSHCTRGESIVGSEFKGGPIGDIVALHHEQFNGKGFPKGLSGDEIPLMAQIVSAASIYDNLIQRGNISLTAVPEYLHRIRDYLLSEFLVTILIELNIVTIQNESSETTSEMQISDLKPGMIITKDICKKSGAIAITAGTVLTDPLIQKLLDHLKMSAIGDRFSILKTSI